MQPVLVLGAGQTGALVAQALLRDRYLGYRIRGFLDDDPAKKKSGLQVNGVCFPVLGGFAECERIVAETGVHDLIVAAPGMASSKLVSLVNSLQRIATSVLVVPDLFGLPVEGVKADYFFDEQVLTFRLGNNLASPVNRIVKRCFDLILGLIAMICLSPLLAAIAVAIRLDSPGPVLFAHDRIGQNGRRFRCYKFRSMAANAQELLSQLLQNNPELQQEWQYHYKIKNDPRITRVGKIPAQHQPGRAAAIDQRLEGRDEPGRPPPDHRAGSPLLRRSYRELLPGAPRPHRSVAGQRAQRDGLPAPGQPGILVCPQLVAVDRYHVNVTYSDYFKR